MTRSSTDEQLRPLIREAFAQLIDELPPPPEAVPVTGHRRQPQPRQSGTAIVLAVAASVVVLVAGLVVVAQLRDGDDSLSTGSSATAPQNDADRRPDDAPTPFVDGVRLVVYVNANAHGESLQIIRDELDRLSSLVPSGGIRYLGPEESLHQARRLLADDPSTLERLTLDNVPTAFYLTPRDGALHEDLAAAADVLRELPEVVRVDVDPTGRPTIPGIPDSETSTQPAAVPSTVPMSDSDATDRPTTSPTLPVAPVDYLAIGDSVMLGAAPELSARGYTVNATVSRQMIDVTPWVDELAEANLVGGNVIVHLGNNGPITADTLDDFLAPLTDADNIIILNIHADRPWADENNRILAERDQPNGGDNIIVIDWNSIAEGCPVDCFAADGIHLSEQGRTFYADAIGDHTGK